MGRPAYTLRLVSIEGATAKQVASSLSRNGGFATAKVEVSDISQANSLVDAGFRVVDVALIFSKDAEGEQTTASVREAKSSDEEAVRAIAGSSFRYSRFHLDPSIPVSLANRIKSEWAGNFFSGKRGNAMLIAETNGIVAGFCQLIFRDGNAVIDLIAVDPSFARRGLARKLLAGVTTCATKRKFPVQKVVVGTQAANTPSVNLYESFGFRLVSSNLVLHYTTS